MKDKPALQAADLLAWASNRVLTAPEVASAKHLEWIMKQIVPSSWVVFDEPRLRQEVSKAISLLGANTRSSLEELRAVNERESE